MKHLLLTAIVVLTTLGTPLAQDAERPARTLPLEQRKDVKILFDALVIAQLKIALAQKDFDAANTQLVGLAHVLGCVLDYQQQTCEFPAPIQSAPTTPEPDPKGSR